MTEKRALNLLDLPVDILREIIREVPHTNDLTSLALTHSALHALAIPLIYSRFDIVWPDGHPTTDNRTGVDALTYGLSTLVMGQDVFGEAPSQKVVKNQVSKCDCGRVHQFPGPQPSSPRPRKKTRRGNNFAQHTRKFSLGNGPEDWVQEYLITKEGGKMLGTLVALALGRMRNLETFIWDMPTGVLRDVWLALGSLADREDDQDCRLERVWVRWHDNSEASSPPQPTLIPTSHPVPHALPTNPLPSSLFQISSGSRVEYPTFSILPPLKSLSVLDIDELPYVQEMSALLEKSVVKLRELRVGLAQHAQYDDWASLPEDKIQVIPSSSDDPSSTPGGLLGILLGPLAGLPFAYDTDYHLCTSTRLETMPEISQIKSDLAEIASLKEAELSNKPQANAEPSIFDSENSPLESSGAVLTPVASFGERIEELSINLKANSTTETLPSLTRPESPRTPPGSSVKLQLEVLELERVSLSIPVMSRSIEWTCLTSLTILGCRHHDQLWKALRKKFSPRPRPGMISTPSTPIKSPKSPSTPRFAFFPEDYPLRLKRLHTDTVSPALITFLKETLAPDSLEWLFLQENLIQTSSVTIEQIYRGPLRRHKASLKKLMIESLDRVDDGAAAAGTQTPSRRWTLTRDVLSFILSGRMYSLRELSVTLDYKDWHFFLQRLPNIPHLRSLFIPHIADPVHGRHSDSRELAMHVLDVVALRPELELCYLGIQAKCFEMLEYPAGHKPSLADLTAVSHAYGVGVEASEDGDEPMHQQPSSDPGEDDGGSDNYDSGRGEAMDTDEDYDDDESGYRRNRPTKNFKLREILFYDDKVSIFKARHGKL